MSNKERNATMCKLIQKGYSLQKVGDMYNLTRERVRQIVNKQIGTGVKEIRRKSNAKLIKKIKNSSLSMSEIAELYPTVKRLVEVHKRMSKDKRQVEQNYMTYKAFHIKSKEKDKKIIDNLKKENKQLLIKIDKLQKAVNKFQKLLNT